MILPFTLDLFFTVCRSPIDLDALCGSKIIIELDVLQLNDFDGLAYLDESGLDPTEGLCIVGTSGRNTISGGNGDDVILGLQGFDVLDGRGGAVRITSFAQAMFDCIIWSAVKGHICTYETGHCAAALLQPGVCGVIARWIRHEYPQSVHSSVRMAVVGTHGRMGASVSAVELSC